MYDDTVLVDKAYYNKLKEQTTWVSVKDRLPEKYEEVLVYSAKYGVQVDWIADNVDYHWWNYGELVTHWMPKPLEPLKE